MGSLISAFFEMGLAQGAADVKKGQLLKLNYLFIGFRKKTFPVIVINLLTHSLGLLSLHLMSLVFSLTAGTELTQNLAPKFEIIKNLQTSLDKNSVLLEQLKGIQEVIIHHLPATAITLLIGIVFILTIQIMTFLAPYFVYFENTCLLDSLKKSIQEGIRHWRTILSFYLSLLLWAVIASIPFGIGWVVLPVVFYIASYCVYAEYFVKNSDNHSILEQSVTNSIT